MRHPGRRGRGDVREVAARAAAVAAVAAAALAAGGCKPDDVLFLVEVRLAESVPRPATLRLATRVTRETGAGDDTIDYATTVTRPWPGDDEAVRVQLALGPDAVAIELTASLLAADGFVIAEAGAAQAFPGPGRYAYLLSIEEGAPPPPDAGGGPSTDAAAGDAATDAGAGAADGGAVTDGGAATDGG